MLKNDFIDKPIFYAKITTFTRRPKMSSVGSNPENILRSERSSTAKCAQLIGIEVAAQMASITVTDVWN